MILGIGVDIVDHDVFRKRLTPELIDELYTAGEIAYAQSQYHPWEPFAARLAAKEAAFKALGAGLADGLRWHDVEIMRHESGRADLRLSGRALEIANDRGVTRHHVSMSHSRANSVAVVVMES
jgi:holo-[acyl-carrier protein] synthase